MPVNNPANVVIYGCITDAQIDRINKAIISDPESGEHKIKEIHLLADTNTWEVVYEGTPEA